MVDSIKEILENKKIIDLNERPRAVFVGDTHGDFKASQKIWNQFAPDVKRDDTYLVFLGDYVDRGRESKKNIDFLLSKKERYPEGVVLLLGNHDAYGLKKLRPADFWNNLSDDELNFYKHLKQLPWLARSDKIVASHGALPFIPDLRVLENYGRDIFRKKDDFDNPVWVSITWGDMNDSISGFEMDPLTGRPQFGRDVVLKYLQKHGWNILIRAHQPRMQGWTFNNNVLTIFTSESYVEMGRARERNVAVVNLKGEDMNREDFEIISLDDF
ncbi:MAG: metallophosphoesterase family protein [Candidatus Hadarchaeota archaeon]